MLCCHPHWPGAEVTKTLPCPQDHFAAVGTRQVRMEVQERARGATFYRKAPQRRTGGAASFVHALIYSANNCYGFEEAQG